MSAPPTMPYRLPGAVIPTPAEMELPIEQRLASLWQRNAGQVQQQFPDREAFMRRFGADRSCQENNGATDQFSESVSGG